MENKEKIREKTERLDIEVRSVRVLMNRTREHMVENINTLCETNGGELDLKDFELDKCELPSVCYDGDGEREYADPYALVTKIKSTVNKDFSGHKYNGFSIKISAEMVNATLLDKELSYEEIESIFEFLTEDEILGNIMDNE